MSLDIPEELASTAGTEDLRRRVGTRWLESGGPREDSEPELGSWLDGSDPPVLLTIQNI